MTRVEYEVIKAKTPEEAIAGSRFKVGDYAIVTEIVATANSNGTYTVNTYFKPAPTQTCE